MLPEGTSEEGRILARAASGEPDAVRSLLDLTGPAVYGFVYARVGGNQAAAEDLVQETFLEAIRSAHTFRGESALRTWIVTIASRRLARYYEAERRQEIARSSLAAVPDSGGPAEGIGRRDELIGALGRLPTLHRQVLIMKYLDDLSVEAIAGLVGKTRVQVQSLLQRARDGLRREMEAGDAPA